ncbi:MAG: asparagine synthase (glutamine-hydrolyzing) [Actinomycetota bacterium]|nr:asparagine synthase (glutamine-hydrolyzing) [Actinomycetota bacterium]
MCGIAGIVRPHRGPPPDEESLLRMAGAIRHRGPDGYGYALDSGAGLVNTRLSIFDLPGGWQPISDGPDGGIIVYNGEVYNHYELRRELEARGESFTTTTDTEIVLRLLDREGIAALDRLNGQFALAWWQPGPRRLTLIRDRFGVRPLHYALKDDGTLVFASEAKAIFASGEVRPEPDLRGIDDVFTLWGPRPPRTVFAGVKQVHQGGVLVWEAGKIVEERTWWTPSFDGDGAPEGDLEELMRDSVRLRLRADVPVGAYLSGGLDSSLIVALAQQETEHQLRTFSVAFHDPNYDERPQQEEVARALGTDHHVVDIGPGEIADAFPDVIRHVEQPLVRTAPVPLFLLSEKVRANDIVVVATGEGADELFWGYDLFKEVVVRELYERDPDEARELLEQLYGYLPAEARRGPAWDRFLLETGEPGDPIASHMTRVKATAGVKAFYRPEVAAEIGAEQSLERLRAGLPASFGGWSSLERASWLEISTLLEPYLLAAQGDRVAMAHGVEGRYPFLDHRVFEFAARLPADRKLAGMQEKAALRDLATDLLPPEIVGRSKQPYRAPEVTPFFSAGSPAWVEESLSPEALQETGIWDETRVAGLLKRCRAGKATGFREGMALIGVLSTQLWHRAFFSAGLGDYPPETDKPEMKLDRTEAKEIA